MKFMFNLLVLALPYMAKCSENSAVCSKSSPPPVILFVGAPFSGKGTQADILSSQLSIPILQSGDLFRSEVKSGSELGRHMEQYMNAGMLIPDELTIDLITKTLSSEKYATAGVIMDGYPRNLAHLDIFLEILGRTDMVEIDAIVYLEADRDLLVSRVESRRICESCGRPISLLSQGAACCDNPILMQRSDDTLEKFEKRYEIFQNETLALIAKLASDYPSKFIRIESSAGADKGEISKLILDQVSSKLH
jgi:adenylate kinase